MVDAAFDGVSLIITLPAGETKIDVETDLYSAWKRFLLADKENLRFPAAFRTIAGDPLAGGLEAAPYFFLNNVAGWRIKPSEEDITINLIGNLIPEDETLPVVIPTTGDFTVLILGIQAITQGLSAILVDIELIRQATAGDIVIDPDDLGFTIFKSDGTTVLATYTRSADGRIRRKV